MQHEGECPEAVGNEKNWLELDVAGHGKKYLPIKRKAKLCSDSALHSNIFGEGVKSCWLVQSNGACFENGSKKKASTDLCLRPVRFCLYI